MKKRDVAALGLLALMCLSSTNAFCDDAIPDKCPDRATLQTDLKNLGNTNRPSALAVSGALSSVLPSVAGYLTDRAKQEGEEYAEQVALKKLCTSEAGNYFPEACGYLSANSTSPQFMSTGQLLDDLRWDAKHIPACYAFKNTAQIQAETSAQFFAKDSRAFAFYLLENEINDFVTEDTPNYSNLAAEIQAALTVYDPQLGIDTASFVKDATAQIKKIAGAKFSDKNSDQVIAAIFSAALSDLTYSGDKSTGTLSAAMIAALGAGLSENYEGALSAIRTNVESQVCKDDQQVCDLITAFAAIANKKGDDDAKAAMEAFFGQATTWQEKATTGLLSIDAMVGASAGGERVSGPVGGFHSTYGAFLPIGLDLNFPTGGLCSSSGVFLSVLDIGAWASYSSKTSNPAGSTQGKSNVNGSSALSPGLYGVCTIENSPFRVGLGVSQTPALRSVNLSNGTSSTESSFRVLMYVSIDVPLFDITKF